MKELEYSDQRDKAKFKALFLIVSFNPMINLVNMETFA